MTDSSDSEEYSDVEQASEEDTDGSLYGSEQNSDEEQTGDMDDNITEGATASNFVGLSGKNDDNRVQKSTSVKNQLALWELLLKIRIQFQKCLGAANKLPHKENLGELGKLSSEFSDKLAAGRTNLSDVLEKLLSLQKLLIENYPETKHLLKQDGDSSNETDPIPRKKKKICHYEDDVSNQFHKYKDYRNEVIGKWNEIAHIGKTNSYSVLNQIDYALSDTSKLNKGPKSSAEDNDLFDDNDFYHQLLREFIEVKSSDFMDPLQRQKQWLNLANARKKMKRNIDTKATKGRKIRYAVHSKLVNTMAPMNITTYTNEGIDQIYSSLFVKDNV